MIRVFVLLALALTGCRGMTPADCVALGAKPVRKFGLWSCVYPLFENVDQYPIDTKPLMTGSGHAKG